MADSLTPMAPIMARDFGKSFNAAGAKPPLKVHYITNKENIKGVEGI